MHGRVRLVIFFDSIDLGVHIQQARGAEEVLVQRERAGLVSTRAGLLEPALCVRIEGATCWPISSALT